MKKLLSLSLLLFTGFLAGCSALKAPPEPPAPTEAELQQQAILQRIEESLITVDEQNQQLPAMDQKSFEEYDNFKLWLRARVPGSAEFNDFQEWLRYREYLRLTTEKNKNN